MKKLGLVIEWLLEKEEHGYVCVEPEMDEKGGRTHRRQRAQTSSLGRGQASFSNPRYARAA